MKVAEVINKFLELIGNPENKDVSEYVKLYNIVEQDLCSDYIYLYHTETFDCAIKPYNEFRYGAYRITKVENRNYALRPDAIISTDGNNLGKVTYSIVSNCKTFEDESSYPDRYLKIIALGMCAEYCLAMGNYAEAKIWCDSYKHQLLGMFRDRREGIIVE